MVTKISLGSNRRKYEIILGAGESLTPKGLERLQGAVPGIDSDLKIIDRGYQTRVVTKPPFRTSGIVCSEDVTLENGQQIVILDNESGHVQLTIRRAR